MPLTREELLAALKNEHGIDVAALQAAAAAPPAPDAAALSSALVNALTEAGVVQLTKGDTGSEVSLSDVTAAVVELAADNKNLRGSVAALERQAAVTEVEGYIAAGRLLPKTHDTAVELALSNRDALEAILAPENSPYVQLSRQEGVGGADGEQRQEQDIDAEVARLTAQHKDFFAPDGTRQ